MRMTEEQYQALVERRSAKGGGKGISRGAKTSPRATGEASAGKPDATKPQKRAKYRNQPTYVDGIRFDSKAEAKHYKRNEAMIARGEMLRHHLQVKLYMPAQVPYTEGEKPEIPREMYIVDFVEFYPDGSVKYVDVKGVETKDFKRKKRIIEATNGITIETPKE